MTEFPVPVGNLSPALLLGAAASPWGPAIIALGPPHALPEQVTKRT